MNGAKSHSTNYTSVTFENCGREDYNMKGRILLLLTADLSQAELLEVLKLSAIYKGNGTIKNCDFYDIYDICIEKLKGATAK